MATIDSGCSGYGAGSDFWHELFLDRTLNHVRPSGDTRQWITACRRIPLDGRTI